MKATYLNGHLNAKLKGEKIRLRAGHYNSRQAASDALVKLQKDGLSGIVISHE